MSRRSQNLLSTTLTCQATHQIPSQLMIGDQIEAMDSSTSTMLKSQKSISTVSDTSLTAASTTNPPRKASLIDHATPAAMVSAFCLAVLSRLIPHEFWGVGDIRVQNEAVFHRNVRRFIELRRFETLSLHEVSQGIKVGVKEICLANLWRLICAPDREHRLAWPFQKPSTQVVTI